MKKKKSVTKRERQRKSKSWRGVGEKIAYNQSAATQGKITSTSIKEEWKIGRAARVLYPKEKQKEDKTPRYIVRRGKKTTSNSRACVEGIGKSNGGIYDAKK